MNVFERIRGWFGRSAPTETSPTGTSPVAADPEDLHGNTPENAGASNGLDRPFPESGPVAQPPVADPPSAEPPERPLG